MEQELVAGEGQKPTSMKLIIGGMEVEIKKQSQRLEKVSGAAGSMEPAGSGGGAAGSGEEVRMESGGRDEIEKEGGCNVIGGTAQAFGQKVQHELEPVST